MDRLAIRKKIFTVRVVRHCLSDCPERWWVPHPWRQPRSGWMGFENLMELWVSLFIAGELG